ncbi:MAG: adenylate/guanylate cyclase domain-containing protein [Fimbriimonadaceae bacterium]|nr:adenylate/guanylate cyclase domain-containing protein [Fimbriimonadaceae bacterium]
MPQRAETIEEFGTEGFQNDRVREMLDLADRLVESHGGRLDDSAISAVAEATGADPEYVRLALSVRSKQRKESILARLRTGYLALDPSVRTNVAAGYLAAVCALAAVLSARYGDRQALGGIFQLVCVLGALYNAAISRTDRVALVSGGLFGALYFIGQSLIATILSVEQIQLHAFVLIPYTAGGALAALAAYRLFNRHRARLGLKDPIQERQELLQQLVQIQDKLKSAEQDMTFLSADIVGSTRMKSLADPLAVEFTFNEYHKFVELVVRKHGGSVHSTAGDGVTCAFAHPSHAFSAGKHLQVGLTELNQFRNRIGAPIALRIGIHTGTVLTPSKDDVRSVNFSEVIDVAAHIQKSCPVGGVAVSEKAAAHLPGGMDAIGPDRVEVQTVRAAVWMPRVVLPLSGSAAPPPLPEGA